jgi:hypothetical protein
MSNKKNGISQTVEGFYKLSVINEVGDVVWEQPNWQKNLVLNNGMDMIASVAYEGCMLYAFAGNGTRQNSIFSNASTITQTGTTITLNPLGSLQHFTQSAGGYISGVSAGDVIVYATSSIQTNVISVSDMTCVVDQSQTIGVGEQFTIWKTSQSGLQNPLTSGGGRAVGSWTQPSGSYWLPGYCGSEWVGNIFQMTRTYDFGVEASLQNYTEIGVGKTYTLYTPGYCFSRILLTNPVAINVGQRLRVAYQLNVSVEPSTPVYRSGVTQPIITNWPVSPSTNTNATESLQYIDTALEGISSNGDPSFNNNDGSTLDPSSQGYVCYAWISPDSKSLAPFGLSYDRTPNSSNATMTRASYPGNGSYYCDKSVTFDLTQINRNDIRSFGFGYGINSAGNNSHAYALLFDQTKTNIQTLSLSWRFQWNRTLTNGSN